MKKGDLKPLAFTFAASGVWDTVAGILYLFMIGTGRSIDDPPTHHFYSVFLASFFFCFAYIVHVSSEHQEICFQCRVSDFWKSFLCHTALFIYCFHRRFSAHILVYRNNRRPFHNSLSRFRS